MFKFLRSLYYNTTLGAIILRPAMKLRNLIIPQKAILKFRFKRLLGYKLNLESPKSYNEKLQWLKLHDRSGIHEICADKHAVRSYIKDKVGSDFLIPLLFSTKEVDEITQNILPEYPVIIKTNHDSGGVTIIRDKKKIDLTKLAKKWKKQLNANYDSGKGEWQYKNIEPRLVVEKLLLDESGNIPSDYKFHCFNGKVAFIQVDLERVTNHKRNLYDVKWNLLPCSYRYEMGYTIEAPNNFDEMVALAEKLSEDFICVRVDLYSVKNKIYFGELTFHSESGFGPFKPQEWDYKFGEMLQLPIDK